MSPPLVVSFGDQSAGGRLVEVGQKSHGCGLWFQGLRCGGRSDGRTNKKAADPGCRVPRPWRCRMRCVLYRWAPGADPRDDRRDTATSLIGSRAVVRCLGGTAVLVAHGDGQSRSPAAYAVHGPATMLWAPEKAPDSANGEHVYVSMFSTVPTSTSVSGRSRRRDLASADPVPRTLGKVSVRCNHFFDCCRRLFRIVIFGPRDGHRFAGAERQHVGAVPLQLGPADAGDRRAAARSVVGRTSASAVRVASVNTTYAGTLASRACSARHSRSRSNSSSS